jgi:Ctr copper transporter family
VQERKCIVSPSHSLSSFSLSLFQRYIACRCTGFRLSLLSSSTDTPSCLNLLFSAWTLNTRFKFIAAAVAVFFFAVAVEALAKLRHVTVQMARGSGVTQRRNNASTTSVSGWKRRILRYCIPVLHGLQALTGYTLMLVTMTFSVELLVSVVTGLAVGYGIFFRLTNNSNDNDNDNDRMLRQHVTANPCCEFMQEETKESFATESSTLILLNGEEEASSRMTPTV